MRWLLLRGACLGALVVALARCGAPGEGARDAAADTGPTVDDAGALDATRPDATMEAPPHEVLFVGNSYVFVNDVLARYRAMVSTLGASVRTETVAPGGYRWAQHAADAQMDGTPLAHWLREASPEGASFDAVVLQEQSQIGGFPSSGRSSDVRTASILGATELARLANARGARAVLYLTWGREHGDTESGMRGFDSFTGMADCLDHGYLGLAARMREQGVDVDVAPVGGGFRLVFEDVVARGEDPLVEGSDFDALYEPDGSHPSLRGAYLAACVLAGTITGADVRAFPDEPELGTEVSRSLLDVCARALVDPRWHVPSVLRPGSELTGAEAGTRLGARVATDATATRLWVSERGRARAFALDGASWNEEGAWETGEPRGVEAIALSGDGSSAFLSRPPRAYLRGATGWSPDPRVPEWPGRITASTTSVALSDDGSRAVIGAHWDPSGDGVSSVAARILVRDGDAWVEEAMIPPTLGALWVPISVAMDAAGERAIIADTAVRVLVRGESGWTVEATLDVPDVEMGAPVALSADGTHAIVGQSAHDRVLVHVRAGSSWRQHTILRGRPGSGLGESLAVSADGSRVLVGARQDAPAATDLVSGSARLFVRRDGAYRHELVLVPSRAPSFSGFGLTVAMSRDGTRSIVGAETYDTDAADGAGAVFVFSAP